MVDGDFEFNPKYDEIIWSGMCYLKEVGKDYSIGGFDMSIISKDGKFGMIYTEHWNVSNEDFPAQGYTEYGALECIYDSIYSLRYDNNGWFVVFQGGKCGLVQAVCNGYNGFLECKEVFPCVYDRIELLDNGFCEIVLLQSERKLFYYNIKTGHRSPFYDRIWTEKSFIFSSIGQKSTVTDGSTDRIIFESHMFFEYLGVNKNRFVFLERSRNTEIKKNGRLFANGRFCFYDRRDGTAEKNGIYKNVMIIPDKQFFSEEVFGSLKRTKKAKRIRCFIQKNNAAFFS